MFVGVTLYVVWHTKLRGLAIARRYRKMKTITQSLHIGTGNHNIATKNKLYSISKHNERLYKDKEQKNIYNFYQGTISKNVSDIYDRVFGRYVESYNLKQKRADRKIDDYLDYISKDKRQNIATEIILQYGDREFWKDKSWKTDDKEKIMMFFRNQINEFQSYSESLLSNYRGASLNIAQATLHFDEDSPHLHLICIPAMPSKRHVALQPNKSLFFANERLTRIHDYLREKANEFFTKEYGVEVVKLDEPSRSYVEIGEYKRQKEKVKDLEESIERLTNENNKLEDSNMSLSVDRDYLNYMIENMEMKYSSLKSGNEKLQEKNDELRQEINRKNKHSKQLSSEILELSKKYERIKPKYESLSERYEKISILYSDDEALKDSNLPFMNKFIVKLCRNKLNIPNMKNMAAEVLSPQEMNSFEDTLNSILRMFDREEEERQREIRANDRPVEDWEMESHYNNQESYYNNQVNNDDWEMGM